MSKFLKWFDGHILEYLSFALLIFIPLYPKIPLADLIPGYIVRLRLDDLLVGGALAIFLIQLVRKKVSLKGNPLFIPLLIYVIIGFISSLSAMFVTKTVPMSDIHITKLFLNWARRIEYFSVFFIFFSSIKSLSQIRKYIYVAAFVLFVVSIYGFGQKYLYWPAFSTMNMEFAKGWMLYLTEHARVLSTFGGHYDLAAFVMMALVLLWSLFFSVKKLFFKVAVFLILSAAFWTLILTASRTSFLAYLAGLFLMFAFWSFRKGITWS